MCSIAINALYTSLLRRGTTRQLAGAIVVCVLAALLLLPAIVWYALRFDIEQVPLSLLEVDSMLVYVSMCGLLIPLSITGFYCLFAQPRTTITSTHIPSQKRSTQINTSNALHPPRHQPGQQAPYVFGEDTPWGWLEYRGGRFHGQRLALKRSIITIGRDESSDIWLDDDLASRHHAELAWDQGQVYITDCDSLNGVLLNGRRIHGSAQLVNNEMMEIGSHRFIFTLAEHNVPPSDLSDPLAHHIWRSSQNLQSSRSDALSATVPLGDHEKNLDLVKQGQQALSEKPSGDARDSLQQMEAQSLALIPPSTQQIPPLPLTLPISDMEGLMTELWKETAELKQVSPPAPPSSPASAIVVRDGNLAGRIFLLDYPVITVGRGIESDIVIEEASISRQHVQFLRQPNGDYIQDLSSRNGTRVNGELLTHPRQLHPNDIITIGNITLEYIPIQQAQTASLPHILTPQPISHSASGPKPLRLPSKNRGT
jgi:pSer/pThr/pTyr-binding forkhead associated (FHA) protein